MAQPKMNGATEQVQNGMDGGTEQGHNESVEIVLPKINGPAEQRHS